MAKFTISADTVEELQQAYVELFGALVDAEPATTEAPAANGDKPKQTRTRKKPEAPAPFEPQEAAAAPAPGVNPFAAPQPEPVANPFAAAAEPAAPFAPGPSAATDAPVDRPAVARLKEQLRVLGAQHGEAQVYTWAIQKAFGLSPATTPEEFLTKIIHTIPDEALNSAYSQAGGKA